MKKYLFITLLLVFSLQIHAQNDTISVVKHSESSHIINKNSKVVY